MEKKLKFQINNELRSMKTFDRKSLLSSLYQIPKAFGTLLAKRGGGRFLKACHFTYVLISNINLTMVAAVFLLFITGCASVAEREKPEIKLFWPPPPQEPRIEYMHTISSPADIGITKTWFGRIADSLFGREEIEDIFVLPHGVFYSDRDRLLVTDTGNSSVHILDLKNREYINFNKIGKDEALISPIGIVEDTDGNIYVSDSMLNRIFVFDKQGGYIFSFGDNLKRPTGLAIDNNGKRLFVTDTVSAKVVVYDLKGKELYSFGKLGNAEGEFNFPTHIFFGGDGLLYVSDTLNFRVQAFDKNGGFRFMFGKPGDGSGDMSKPKGVAVDTEGHIYVVDSVFETVQIFGKDGRLLLAFGSSGSGPADLNIPSGIFIDKKDNIYVVDSFNKRVHVFRYLKQRERK